MFEVLANLILTSLFLQSQADSQATIDNLTQQEYRLPNSAVRYLQQTAPQQKVEAESLGVSVTAKSVLVIDKKSAKILYQKNPDRIRSIASLTKLMTALVFLDHNPGWDTPITISGNDYRSGGVTYLIAGEEISARGVFNTALIASANEAAVALWRSTGLSEENFIGEMNQKVQELGMADTVFTDVTGLKNDNASTATDVILMVRAALDRPDIFQAV